LLRKNITLRAKFRVRTNDEFLTENYKSVHKANEPMKVISKAEIPNTYSVLSMVEVEVKS
jgi:hypothetical protein